MDVIAKAERNELPRLVTGVAAARIVGVTTTTIWQWALDGELDKVATLSDGKNFYVLYREDQVIEANERRKDRRRRITRGGTLRYEIVRHVMEYGVHDPEAGTYTLDVRTSSIASALDVNPCTVSRIANDLVASGCMERPFSDSSEVHKNARMFRVTPRGVRRYGTDPENASVEPQSVSVSLGKPEKVYEDTSAPNEP